MKTFAILLAMLICVVVANARHIERSDTEVAEPDNDEEAPRKVLKQMRRRKRWQSNFGGYNYPPPPHQFYPENRRDFDVNQQDLLPQIYRLLDEISAYIRRPPPPPAYPQPIYIPYPVMYPTAQSCNCGGNNKPNVTLESRVPEMDDINRNWGFASKHNSINNDPEDGARPLSFDPIGPKRPLRRPAQDVEHGTSQAADIHNTQETIELTKKRESSISPMGNCDGAILSCCSPSDSSDKQRKCFTDLGCSMSYKNGKACSMESVNDILDSFAHLYTAH